MKWEEMTSIEQRRVILETVNKHVKSGGTKKMGIEELSFEYDKTIEFFENVYTNIMTQILLYDSTRSN